LAALRRDHVSMPYSSSALLNLFADVIEEV
jgi:hypothetical protein